MEENIKKWIGEERERGREGEREREREREGGREGGREGVLWSRSL